MSNNVQVGIARQLGTSLYLIVENIRNILEYIMPKKKKKKRKEERIFETNFSLTRLASELGD